MDEMTEYFSQLTLYDGHSESVDESCSRVTRANVDKSYKTPFKVTRAHVDTH